jgi:hypothetical protein
VHLLGLEAVPSFNDLIVKFLLEVKGLHTVVGDADADVGQADTSFHCVIKGEALVGFEG